MYYKMYYFFNPGMLKISMAISEHFNPTINNYISYIIISIFSICIYIFGNGLLNDLGFF